MQMAFERKIRSVGNIGMPIDHYFEKAVMRNLTAGRRKSLVVSGHFASICRIHHPRRLNLVPPREQCGGTSRICRNMVDEPAEPRPAYR